MDNANEKDFDTITIVMENDEEVECSIITYLEVDDKEYIVLLPLEEESEEVYIYRFHLGENEEPVLENITDDDEYDAVSDAYEEFLDDLDYEDYYSDQDED